MTKRYILIIAALTCGVVNAAAQGFFNLTAGQVRIDSLLPQFTYSQELEGSFADTIYDVTIDYPEFINMSQADVQRYHNITTDTLPEMPDVFSHVGVARKRGTLDIAFVPLVRRDGKYQKLVSFKLNVKARPKDTVSSAVKAMMKTAKSAATDRYAEHSVLRNGTWAKIRVAESGVYQITDELIRQAGFSNPAQVKIYGYGGTLQPETLTDDYLRSTDDLTEVPTCSVGGRRLFYAQGPVSWSAANDRIRNPYSDHGYYFLTESNGTPLTVDEQTFINSFYPSAIHYNTLYEVDDFAWYHGGRNLYDAQPFTPGTSRTYTIPAAGAPGSGSILIVLTADADSKAQITFNGTNIGTASVNGTTTEYIKALSGRTTLRLNNIITQTNTITITQQSGGTMRLDYMALHCNEPAGKPDLSSISAGTPEFVYLITNQDHHADGPADMIIILPTSQKLRAQAERLKELHEQKDGMSVRIVPADELFNEFSSGTPDATAYRRYMKMLYDRAATEEDMPRYLLLFGDGGWDNRMLSQEWKGLSPDDFLLCFESENSFSATDCYVSDDFFCLLDDGEKIQESANGSFLGKSDVAVGRFPVRTEEEATTLVDKVSDYISNKKTGSWQNTLVFMGDDGNNNIHMQTAYDVSIVAENAHPAYDIKRIMWDAYKRTTSATGNSYPDVTRLIKQHMAGGALMMNYSGHGSATLISHEKVVTAADFGSIASAGLPLWVTASCDIMPFDGQEENIGESAIFNKNGGAIAFVGTTRTVYTDRNKRINTAFTREVLKTQGGQNSIGEALRLAKNAMVYNPSVPGATGDNSVNKLHYTLLGDPALKLAIPQYTTVIDRINDMPIDGDEPLQLKAGMQATVTGHIENNGQKMTDFNGQIYSNISDATQTIECMLNNTSNDGGAQVKFVYYDRPNSIFKGSDAVRDGDFSFTFTVPKDISYSDETGMITVFAASDDKSMTAHGCTDNIVMNGSVDFNPDGRGPSIYCYLNSETFTNGGDVNTTPYFYAELNDDDGINAAGGGIGHDLQLIIDGDMATTYTLNDYFAYDFGTYRSGRVGFSIPQLTPGQHRLQFRAWDVLNYSSTAELAFNVVSGDKPDIIDISCSPNPATTYTTFRIIHDRIGSNIGAILDIYDMAGRHLWSQPTDVTPDNNTIAITWDLTTGGGSRLGNGVYIYRIRLNSEGGSYASKAKKLIILSNK